MQFSFQSLLRFVRDVSIKKCVVAIAKKCFGYQLLIRKQRFGKLRD